VLQRRGFGLVDPAGTGGGGDGDNRAIKSAFSTSFLGGPCGGCPDAFGRMQAGIGTDRFDRGLAVELGELLDRRARRHEDPTLVAERLPTGERLRGAGPALR